MPVKALLGLAVGPGLDVDHPGVLAQIDYLRVVGIVYPGVHVGPVASPAQLSRYLEQVYVHASGVALAQPGKRTAVHAQQGQAVHVLFVFPIAVAESAQGSSGAGSRFGHSTPYDHAVDLTVLSPKPVLVVLGASQEVEDAVT